MEVLQSAFDLENQPQANPLLALAASFKDDEDDETISLTPENKEAIQNVMEKYIRERQEIYSDLLDAKALAEQELSEAD